MKKSRLIAFVLLASLSCAAYAQPKQAAPEKPGVPKIVASGDVAPEWTLKDTEGTSLSLSQFKGNKGVVMVFFATWCPDCMKEVPEVIKFQEAYKDRGVVLFGVDQKQPVHTVEKFIKDKGVNYKVLLDGDNAVSAKYGADRTGIPFVVGIDSQGTVRYAGRALPKDLDAFVRSLEPASAPAPAAKPSTP